MTDAATVDPYGLLTEPATLKIQRLLPGPLERIWVYLTESDMRRKWLASGFMEMKVGAPFELVWRNNELTDPPGQRPEGFGETESKEIAEVIRVVRREVQRQFSNHRVGDPVAAEQLAPVV